MAEPFSPTGYLVRADTYDMVGKFFAVFDHPSGR